MSSKKKAAAPKRAGGHRNGARPQVSVMRYTPELAEKILNDPRMKNRALRAGRVEQYATDMINGDWQENGETIKFDWNGVLIDGQHRLWAVIESGKTVDMLTVEGLDPDVITSIDTNAPRAFRDVAQIQGHHNTALLAAAARWMWWYDQGAQGRQGSTHPTHAELKRVLKENPDLADRAQEVANRKVRNIGSPSTITFVYALAYRQDRVKAKEWLGLLETGAGMDVDHPVYLLREKLISNKHNSAKLSADDVGAFVAKSWLYFKQGKKLHFYRFTKDEAFPKLH